MCGRGRLAAGVLAVVISKAKDGGYTLDHCAILYLMDPDGKLVTVIPYQRTIAKPRPSNVRFWQILLQKSAMTGRGRLARIS
jgi:hypothetical protein